MLEFRGLPIPDFARWIRESSEKPMKHWEKVNPDAGAAKSLTVLIEPYSPYLPTKEGVELSAFYVASNHLHAIAGEHSVNVPVKPLLAGYGIGSYGRNGVISIPGTGTRFAAAVLSSDDVPDPKWVWDADRPLSDECEMCSMCVEACPTNALNGNGRLDTANCLRAQAQFQTPSMPDDNKTLIGSSAWGCEICQEVCLRNAGVKAVSMPEELENALVLKKLLAGDVSELGKWLGTNYARPARMQARACLVAANMGRDDLTCDIEKLLKSPVGAVRECAAWAIERLGGK